MLPVLQHIHTGLIDQLLPQKQRQNRNLPDFEHPIVYSNWQIHKTVVPGKPAFQNQNMPMRVKPGKFTEKNTGIVGEIPGTYRMVMNSSSTVSIAGPTPSSSTTTRNSTVSISYLANGTYSGTEVVTGSSPSTTNMSGTWTDNGDGTVTQVSVIPTATTSTYIPYWVSAYTKNFLVTEGGAYVRQ